MEQIGFLRHFLTASFPTPDEESEFDSAVQEAPLGVVHIDVGAWRGDGAAFCELFRLFLAVSPFHVYSVVLLRHITVVVPLRRRVDKQTPAAPEVQSRDIVWPDELF